MRIAVLCPAEIARRRFLPALSKRPEFTFAGVGASSAIDRLGPAGVSTGPGKEEILANSRRKAEEITAGFGGRIYEGYEAVVTADDVDAVYIPLPPALHYHWARQALLNGKHVLLEKPATLRYEDTSDLVHIAREKGLALHENYMFRFHRQIEDIEKLIEKGAVGAVRLYRISFGFPMRPAGDFRYDAALGGGALFDAGGYTIRYASELLGGTASVAYAQLNGLEGFEVDMYGSGALVNGKGVTAQIAFGMDNQYKCELEVWGSEGTLSTQRILTAPPGLVPTALLRRGQEEQVIELSEDDAFMRSIRYFGQCIQDEELRTASYDGMLRQAELVEEFRDKAGSSGL